MHMEEIYKSIAKNEDLPFLLKNHENNDRVHFIPADLLNTEDEYGICSV